MMRRQRVTIRSIASGHEIGANWPDPQTPFGDGGPATPDPQTPFYFSDMVYAWITSSLRAFQLRRLLTPYRSTC
jgi:hypothetical protein